MNKKNHFDQFFDAKLGMKKAQKIYDKTWNVPSLKKNNHTSLTSVSNTKLLAAY